MTWRLPGMMLLGLVTQAQAQPVSIDVSPAGRHQTMDGFGTGVYSTSASSQAWYRDLLFQDLQLSIVRVDLTPTFAPPASDNAYNSPGNAPGPDGTFARAYTGATDYSASWNGQSAPIVVMGPDIDQNVQRFDFSSRSGPASVARSGLAQAATPDDFKLVGVMWSPAPWLKVQTGSSVAVVPVDPAWTDTPAAYGSMATLPPAGIAGPFIWQGKFSAGGLDATGNAVAALDDSVLGGTGPTSALTQYARGVAAYLRGYQQAFSVKFYGISLQRQPAFEEYFTSCGYPAAADYVAALKAVRAELDRYSDLSDIALMGPDDLLGDNAYTEWAVASGGPGTVARNLQFVDAVQGDSTAADALSLFSVNGAAPDVDLVNGTLSWTLWTQGWQTSPGAGLPNVAQGTGAFGKRGWVTESAVADSGWTLGGFNVARQLQAALVQGGQSGFIYFDFADQPGDSSIQLTDPVSQSSAPRYVALKHFARFVRPGAVRVDATAPGLAASAFVHDTDHSLTVVLINESDSDVSTALSVPSLTFDLSTFFVASSSEGALWQTSTVPEAGGSVPVVVPAHGVTTLVSPPPPAPPGPSPLNLKVGFACGAAPGDLMPLGLVSLLWGVVYRRARR